MNDSIEALDSVPAMEAVASAIAAVPSNDGSNPAPDDAVGSEAASTSLKGGGSQRRVELLVRHRARILARIRRVMRNEQDSLDLLQDVSLVVLRSRMDFTDQEHFLSWCNGVVARVALRWYRQRGRRERLEAEAALTCRGAGLDAISNPEARVVSRQLIDRGLAVVDKTSFELLLARYLDRTSAIELAHDRKQSPASVRMKLSRIRAAMRKAAS